MRKILGAVLVVGLLGLSTTARAFNCPNDFAAAEAAIAEASAAMDTMSDGKAKGLVHTLVDDAKMLLHSARHNHEKPAAGGYDHARAIAKARSAVAYAEAAEILAGK